MKITIYQINMERDKDRVCFLAHESLAKFQGSAEINGAIYDKVFTGEVDCKSLEDVYRMFNLNHPEGYKGRSLSVSDVVEVSESDEVKKGFYFCDSFGFKQVNFEPEKTQEGKFFADSKPENTISVLLVQPGKYPKMITIEDNLEAMQKVVGGDIEEYMPYEEEVAIICNEEGKIAGLPLNRAIYDDDKNMIDIIAGDFFIAYAPISSEKFLSLPKEMADKYREKFKYPEDFRMTEKGISAVPYKPTRSEKER